MNKPGHWVKLYDSFWSSSVGDCSDRVQLLALWFISHARRTDGWYKGVRIPRGSTAYSQRDLAKQFRWSRGSIRLAVKSLCNIDFIYHKTTHHFSIASIRKYNDYQPLNSPPNNPPLAHHKPTTSPTSPVTIEGRRKKEDNTIPTKPRKRGNGCPLVKKSGGKRKHKECVDYISSKGKFPNFAKQIAHLHKILSVGYSFSDIDSLIEEVENEPFYRERGWDFATLANEMGRRR